MCRRRGGVRPVATGLGQELDLSEELKMTTPLVLTFVGRDRPGLVNAISETIAASGGAWLESRLARLAGEFAGIVLVAAPDEQVAALTNALHELDSAGLRVAVAPSAAPASAAGGAAVRAGDRRPRAAGHRARRDADADPARGQHRGIRKRRSMRRPLPASRCSAPRPASACPTALLSTICARRWSG